MKTMDVMKGLLSEEDNDNIKAVIPTLLVVLGKWVDIKETLPQLHEENYVLWEEDAEADYEEKPWDTWESDEVIALTSKGHIMLSNYNKSVKQEDGKTDSWWTEELKDDLIVAWWNPYKEYIEEENMQIEQQG